MLTYRSDMLTTKRRTNGNEYSLHSTPRIENINGKRNLISAVPEESSVPKYTNHIHRSRPFEMHARYIQTCHLLDFPGNLQCEQPTRVLPSIDQNNASIPGSVGPIKMAIDCRCNVLMK